MSVSRTPYELSAEEKAAISDSISASLNDPQKLADVFNWSECIYADQKRAVIDANSISAVLADTKGETYQYIKKRPKDGELINWSQIKMTLVCQKAVAEAIKTDPENEEQANFSEEKAREKQEIKQKLAAFAKQEYERILLVTEITELRNALNKEIVKRVDKWKSIHNRKNEIDGDSYILSPLSTRGSMMLLRNPAINFLNMSVSDLQNATPEELNQMIQAVQALKDLHTNKPSRIVDPEKDDSEVPNPAFAPDNMPLVDKEPLAKKSRKFKLKRTEDESEYQERAYGDYHIWNRFHNNKDIEKQLNSVLEKLIAYREIKLSSEKTVQQEKEKQVEKTKKEKEKQYKETDPFYSLYTNIPNDLKNNLEIRRISNLHEQYDGKEAQQELNRKKAHNKKTRATMVIALVEFFANAKFYGNSAVATKSHSAKTALTRAGIIKDNELDLAQIDKIKTEYPFTYAYQHLRNVLNRPNVKSNLISRIFNQLDAIAEENITEENKLQKLENILLEAYYTARTHKHKNKHSQLADALENLIKDPNELDLIRKYNIDVPHHLKSKEEAPDITTPTREKKRVALVNCGVDLNGNGLVVHSADGKLYLNDELIKKLKYEFDEVVLLYQLNLQNQQNQQNQLAEIKNKLSSEGLKCHVSNAASYDDQINERSKMKLGRAPEFSIFDAEIKNIIKVDNANPSNMYWVRPNECFRLDKPSFAEIKKQHTANANAVNFDNQVSAYLKTRNHPSDFRQELNHALKKYVMTRKLEANLNNSDYHSFFARIVTGMSAKLKMSAANKLLQAIDYETPSYNRVVMHINKKSIPKAGEFDSDATLIAKKTDTHLAIFWRNQGKVYSKTIDLPAVQTITNRLPDEDSIGVVDLIKDIVTTFGCLQANKQKPEPFTNDEIVALRNDRLGNILSHYQTKLPALFLRAEALFLQAEVERQLSRSTRH